jgi:hypothetical protein
MSKKKDKDPSAVALGRRGGDSGLRLNPKFLLTLASSVRTLVREGRSWRSCESCTRMHVPSHEGQSRSSLSRADGKIGIA